MKMPLIAPYAQVRGMITDPTSSCPGFRPPDFWGWSAGCSPRLICGRGVVVRRCRSLAVDLGGSTEVPARARPCVPSPHSRRGAASPRHAGFVSETVICKTCRTLSKPPRYPRSTVHRYSLRNSTNVLEALCEVVQLKPLVCRPRVQSEPPSAGTVCPIPRPIEQAAPDVRPGMRAGNGELVDEHRRLIQFHLSPQPCFSLRSQRDGCGSRVTVLSMNTVPASIVSSSLSAG